MQVLIELDAETHRRLEKVAPAKSRKRSAFIRAAIQKSLWELDEERTRQAYLEMPDNEPAAFDPGVWEALPYGGFDPPVSTRAGKLGRNNGRRKTRATKTIQSRKGRK